MEQLVALRGEGARVARRVEGACGEGARTLREGWRLGAQSRASVEIDTIRHVSARLCAVGSEVAAVPRSSVGLRWQEVHSESTARRHPAHRPGDRRRAPPFPCPTHLTRNPNPVPAGPQRYMLGPVLAAVLGALRLDC
eukprot:459711-Rhodomonas_salina.1